MDKLLDLREWSLFMTGFELTMITIWDIDKEITPHSEHVRGWSYTLQIMVVTTIWQVKH